MSQKELTLNDISSATASMDEDQSGLFLAELARGYEDWGFYPGVPDALALTFLNKHSYIGSPTKFVMHQHDTPVQVIRSSKTNPRFEGLVYSNGAIVLLWPEPKKYLIYLFVDEKTRRLYGYPDPKLVQEHVKPLIDRIFSDDEDTSAG